MHHNNRILARIATYYDNNNQVNNTISQEDSDQAYENYVQSQYSLQSFQSSNWSQVAYNLKYEETRIGLYGDTFKSNKNNRLGNSRIKYKTGRLWRKEYSFNCLCSQ